MKTNLKNIAIGFGVALIADKTGLLNKINIGGIGRISQEDLTAQLELLERQTGKELRFSKAYGGLALELKKTGRQFTGYLSKKEMYEVLRYMNRAFDILNE